MIIRNISDTITLRRRLTLVANHFVLLLILTIEPIFQNVTVYRIHYVLHERVHLGLSLVTKSAAVSSTMKGDCIHVQIQ